jgi:hypothetical protein
MHYKNELIFFFFVYYGVFFVHKCFMFPITYKLQCLCGLIIDLYFLLTPWLSYHLVKKVAHKFGSYVPSRSFLLLVFITFLF